MLSWRIFYFTSVSKSFLKAYYIFFSLTCLTDKGKRFYRDGVRTHPWFTRPMCWISPTGQPVGTGWQQILWGRPHCFGCIHLLWMSLPFPKIKITGMFVKLRLNADSRFCIIWGNSFAVNNKVKGYKYRYLHRQKLLMSKTWHIHLDTKSYPVRYEHLSDIKLKSPH